MEINGVPLHPLVVHAVVVFVPLAALAAILMSVPKWRWLARWPALLVTLGATAACYVATLTGENMKETRDLDSPLIRTHEEWGARLMIAMWVFTALTVVAFWALPHVTRLSGAQDRTARVAALEKPLMVLLPVVAVIVLVLVVLTGDAGARAVWSGG
jgi:cytochrome bd-type quinol oxidase subunit 2